MDGEKRGEGGEKMVKDPTENGGFVATNHVNMNSDIFIALREIARMFVNGTEWNKKARIVLEYDPQEPRMKITTFMEHDEATPTKDREDFLD